VGADRRELHKKIDVLDDGQAAVVEDFVDAIVEPVDVDVQATSWLTASSTWVEAFTARLRAHHAHTTDALTSRGFENAFAACCEAAGWTAVLEESATHRFTDLVLTIESERRSLSLKASSAKGMSRSLLHISKLTEAAWIQDMRRQRDRKPLTVELFEQYRAATDAIFLLRGFRTTAEIEYQLIEIPTTHFAAVADVPAANFVAGTIAVPADDPTFKIRLDRSDAKITLTGIRLDRCTLHGTWTLHLSAPTGP
jgi:hypothetical protein